MRLTLLLAVSAFISAQPCLAQQVPGDAAKAMVGTWELSNSDRDKSCNITFRLDPAQSGYVIALEKSCGEQFPPLRDVAAWTIGKNDMLLFVDRAAKPILELLEVEGGMYEGLRPNEGRYFLQNAAVAAATRDKTADQMFGDWTFTRGAGRPICAVTLANTAANADSFTLVVKSGCDAFVIRFGPASWKMERGQLVLQSAKGEAWRFEETDPSTWARIPSSRPPVLLVKQ
jgi:hypothetical protein